MNYFLRLLVSVLLLSSIRRTSASKPQDAGQVIRVSTRHFAPYMYQDGKGNFYNGMEFQSMQMMAEMLNMSLHFQTTSMRSDVCHNVATNASDICIGGIIPEKDTVKYALMSITYASDDLTWCVRKAEMMPMYLSQMCFIQPSSWFVVIFGYGYPSGLLIYLLIQFDRKYGKRNYLDWHYTTWLIALPAVLGVSPNFYPNNTTTRIFFALLLITAFFLFQIVFTRSHIFLHTQIPWRQVSDFDEIVEKNFDLVGSQEAFNLLNQSNRLSDHHSESFQICEDISECLELLIHHKNFAIGGSHQNILNSPSYSPTQMFCFKDLGKIASYPVATYIRKDYDFKERINSILQRLFEAGFFVKWKRDSQLEGKYEIPYTLPLQLPVTHFGMALVFLFGCGSLISFSTFILEKIIFWKMQQKNKHKIWIYLEQFVDGRRHYLKNLPERLEMQNKNSEIQFPYLE